MDTDLAAWGTGVERRLDGIEQALSRLTELVGRDHDLLTQIEQVMKALPDHEGRIRALEAAVAELQGGRKTLAWIAGLLGVGGGGAGAVAASRIIGG